MEKQNNNQAAKRPPQVFNHQVLVANKARAQTKLANHDFLLAEVQHRLDERLDEVNKTFSSPLHMGFPHSIGKHNPHAENEDLLLKANQFDLITSNLQLHWANDLAGILIQIKRALVPDGLFVASMFGGDTLFELKSSLLEAEAALTDKVMMRTSPMADVRDIGDLMQRSGFALPLIDVDKITVRYKNVISLMHDLRYMGEGSALLKRPTLLRRDVLKLAQKIYEEKFPHSDGEGICATFDVVFLTGWSPHESQQQPLKPGSAAVNLGDVLKKPE